MKTIKIGSTVIATPKNGDFQEEFFGTVVGIKGDFFQVEDQDGDVFDCEDDQVEESDKETYLERVEAEEYKTAKRCAD
jgi:hypothetical protein